MESSWTISEEYTVILILRPLFATTFILTLITLCWLFAWKLMLVHVPLVQELFGLRTKPLRSKPQTRRFSKIYSSINSPILSSFRYDN